MPRGVKGSGPPKGGKAPKPAPAAAAVVVQAPTAPPPAQEPPQAAPAELPRGPGFGDSLKRGQRLDLMDEGDLRAYAKTIGISPRDCTGLTVERLRQNCAAQLYELIDAL